MRLLAPHSMHVLQLKSKRDRRGPGRYAESKEEDPIDSHQLAGSNHLNEDMIRFCPQKNGIRLLFGRHQHGMEWERRLFFFDFVRAALCFVTSFVLGHF